MHQRPKSEIYGLAEKSNQDDQAVRTQGEHLARLGLIESGGESGEMFSPIILEFGVCG